MKMLQTSFLLALTLIVASSLLPGRLALAADTLSDTAPPAPRVEHEPPHRDGYAWAPGYWEWNGRFFHWISGTWILERRNQHWVPDHWDPIGNQWQYVRGHWDP